MKKYIAMGGVWLAILVTMLTCSSKASLEYEIHFDTFTKTTYRIKEEIQDVYAQLVSGVHSESYILMVMHNLEMFEVENDVEATWEQNALILRQGDGKGAVIKGELLADTICMPKVQPRSFLKELFGSV